MNVQIQSVKFDADKRLVEFVENKMDKLDRFAERSTGAEVILRLDKDFEKGNKIATVTLHMPGEDLVACHQSRSFEESVDEAIDAIKRQLFTNIIANALKHSADGTTVLVDAHEDENQGTIVTNVVNFGSQIAPSDRLDIFRRFVKGKTGPGTESGGTGLGLSIARWAAQLHGGTVKVVDDTRGADFEIILPKYHIAER